MSKLKEPVTLETTFGSYVVDEIIGEGGSGRVYASSGPDRTPVAIKVLSNEKASADKRRRFKNEVNFLIRNAHQNIVTVLDHGISSTGTIRGPFYVMKKYDGNLRRLIGSIPPERVLPLFSQILDGVEAAHLKGVIHRDLKPENVLADKDIRTLAVADFGIARFTEELLATFVETAPTQRLANFTYAAPEQRIPGREATASSDIYALGLILNEMFTSAVPLGTGYQLIEKASPNLAFLDEVVAKMIGNTPTARPASIAEVKMLIQRHQAEAVSLQKLSAITNTVVKMGEVDEPLAHEAPRIIGGDWNNGRLKIKLDRPVTPDWIQALHNIGNFTSVMGIPPSAFSFQGDVASVGVDGRSAQKVIDFFKEWLPTATRDLKLSLEIKARSDESQRRDQLRRAQLAEEERLKTNRALKF